MASLSLAFDILARDKASQTLDKVGTSAEKTGGKLSALSGVAKGAGLLAGGVAAAGIAGLGAALIQGGKDAVSFQTLALKTEAVIKSTGNVANISVDGIQKLAGNLESLSGVDEELIINSQNVLATFTKIRNEAGKGNKIFDRATESALNMSVALGQDLQSATTMVGKALNDPIKGITAMSRAGVQFTKEQENQIKWLVKNGRQMDAQKIILGELETQFGGTAEAAGKGLAGDMARLQDVLGDTFRQIATDLLPTVTALAQWFAERLPGALARFKAGFEVVTRFFQNTLIPNVQQVIGIFREEGLGGVLANLGERFQAAWPGIQEALGNIAMGIWNWVAETAPVVGQKLLELGGQLVAWIGPQIPPLLAKLGELIGAAGLWILEKGVPALALHVRNLVPALVDWIATEAIPAIIEELPGILRSVRDWVQESIPRFVGFGARLARAIKEGFQEALKNIFEGFSWTGAASGARMNVPGTPWDIKIPKLAGGGRAFARMPHIIGENGPELFVPDVSGRVIPNHLLMSGRAAQSNTYNVYNPVPEPVSDTVRHLKRLAADRAS